jgi:purine-binding chemotaxis protein CheW
MGPGWERVVAGHGRNRTGPLLLVDVAALIAGAEAKRAQLKLFVTLRV